MAKILVTDGMAASAVKDLKDAGFEVTEEHYEEADLIQKIADYDCIVVRSATKVTKAVIDGGKNLKLIIRGGVGVDNIDMAYAKEKGVHATNTPAASSASVAELALGLMYSVARQIPAANQTMKEGKWEKKKYGKGFEVGGKMLGIIGMGRIGRDLAKKAKSLGMSGIIGFDAFIDAQHVDEVLMVKKEELLKRSDFITLHVPFDKKRGAVLGPKEFEMMKDGVVIINCARGGVVDEDALLASLNSGKVRAAGIDVWIGEPSPRRDLVEHPNVVAMPHVGAGTGEAQGRVGAEVVQIVKDFFK